MFFDINTVPLANFPCCYALGNLFVNTDSGWKHKRIADHDVVYKGYMDAASLECSLEQILSSTEPLYTGNFCVIAYHRKNQIFSIKSDRWRSFPIYLDVHHSINNLIPKERTAWTDSLISFDDAFNIQENKFDVIGQAFTSGYDTVSIWQHLLDKTQRFHDHNPGPIKIFLSGGVDTLLVYSCVLALDLPHEVVWASHVDHDYFWLSNHADIQRYWSYTQIHHWTVPTVLASGAPGDEFMLRSPTTANLWLLDRGTSIPQQIKPEDLHWHYFNKPEHQQLFQHQAIQHQHIEDIDRFVCDMVLNDWQHWHLGQTLTWTPLRDLDLIKMMLALPLQQVIAQICRSEVSIDLIEKNRPGLSTLISQQKNSGNFMSNLRKWSGTV
jgi:hypothetical protein